MDGYWWGVLTPFAIILGILLLYLTGNRQLGVEEGALRPVEEGLDRRGLRRGFKGMDHPPRRGTPGGRVDPVRRIPDAPVLRLDDPHRPRPQE